MSAHAVLDQRAEQTLVTGERNLCRTGAARHHLKRPPAITAEGPVCDCRLAEEHDVPASPEPRLTARPLANPVVLPWGKMGVVQDVKDTPVVQVNPLSILHRGAEKC